MRHFKIMHLIWNERIIITSEIFFRIFYFQILKKLFSKSYYIRNEDHWWGLRLESKRLKVCNFLSYHFWTSSQLLTTTSYEILFSIMKNINSYFFNDKEFGNICFGSKKFRKQINSITIIFQAKFVAIDFRHLLESYWKLFQYW